MSKNARGKLEVWADWVGLDAPTLMGTLFTTPSRGTEIFSFEYDHLLGVHDSHRMGALRFRAIKDGHFLDDNQDMASPPWTSLRELEQVSLDLERDDAQDDPDYARWLPLLLWPGVGIAGSPEASRSPGPRTQIAGPTRDWFGYRSAVSDSHVVVAAPLTTVAGKREAGAVFVYAWEVGRRGPPPPAQRIEAPQPQLAGRFGSAVAIGGNRLVVGAPGKAAAFVFEQDENGRLRVVATLAPPASAGWVGHSWFGSSVAIVKGWIIVGAPAQANASGLDPAGSVHLFRVGPSGLVRYHGALRLPEAEAEAETEAAPEPGDGFGMALAASGRTLVVGAPRDRIGKWRFRGSAHVFRLGDDDVWRHEARLQPAGRPWCWSGFGGSVDVDVRGRVAVAGGRSHWALSGAAMVYQRDAAGRWSGTAVRPTLSSDLPPAYKQPTSASSSVRLRGGRLLLAMPHPAPGFPGAGVLLFTERDGVFVQQELLRLPPGNAPEAFWHMSLSLRRGEAMVGVLHNDTSVGARARGSVHRFRLSPDDRATPGRSTDQPIS